MKFLCEKLNTPVLGEYDIIVVGGGVAGVCAAVSARRAGVKRVLLLEKSILFGGLATQGLISLYEPLCDGYGHKITYGMGAELMRLCMLYGSDTLPESWRGDPDCARSADIQRAGYSSSKSTRYKTFYSPTMFALALDEFVRNAGADMLFDTLAVSPVMKGKICSGIIVENKSGRGFYKAKAVIDATGDADILFRAGVPCVEGFNYMTFLAYRTDMETIQTALAEGNMLKSRKWTLLGSGPKGNGHPAGMPVISGTTAKEITDYVMTGRSMMLDSIRDEDRFKRDLSILPTMAQLRTIRHIAGAYTVQESDFNKRFEDSVAPISDFLNEGKWYELPYRALYHPEYPNFWTAGRAASAEGWAWAVIRVIPGCACSGQAAGLAAALCIKHSYGAGELPYPLLHDALKADGGRTHP